MLVTSLKNFNDFFRNKPPAVIFWICLLTMMVAMFGFTCYVKYGDNIINNDVLQNWITLSEHLSKMEVCLLENGNARKSAFGKDVMVESQFETFITISSSDFKVQTSTIEAYYDLSGWQPVCADEYEGAPVLLKINFTLPAIVNESSVQRVCATVTGPKYYLPDYSQTPCEPSEPSDINRKLLFYASDVDTCIQGTNSVKFSFDGRANANKFATGISQNDVSIIYIHLMWSSCVLLFFILLMLLYAFFYQYEGTKYYRTV